MKRYIKVKIAASILDEDVAWLKSQIDKGKFSFAHKTDNGKYIINAKEFENYLLKGKIFF